MRTSWRKRTPAQERPAPQSCHLGVWLPRASPSRSKGCSCAPLWRHRFRETGVNVPQSRSVPCFESPTCKDAGAGGAEELFKRRGRLFILQIVDLTRSFERCPLSGGRNMNSHVHKSPSPLMPAPVVPSSHSFLESSERAAYLPTSCAPLQNPSPKARMKGWKGRWLVDDKRICRPQRASVRPFPIGRVLLPPTRP